MLEVIRDSPIEWPRPILRRRERRRLFNQLRFRIDRGRSEEAGRVVDELEQLVEEYQRRLDVYRGATRDADRFDRLAARLRRLL